MCYKSLNNSQTTEQNAAATLTKTKKRAHITLLLMSLHWLPVYYRISFKILLVTFKALHGLAPDYISELLCLYQNTV